jgi:hypothetical protein
MQRPLTSKNANSIRIGNLQFTLDNGQLIIREGAYFHRLTGQEPQRVLYLLLDYRTDIIVVSVLEQRDAEQKKKEARGQKKPEYEVVNGKRVEVLNLDDEEEEA